MKNDFIQILLQYEIRSSWWASYISNPYLQDLSGKYFAWKVIRKYKFDRESKICSCGKEYLIECDRDCDTVLVKLNE
jgi:hypothetical protein